MSLSRAHTLRPSVVCILAAALLLVVLMPATAAFAATAAPQGAGEPAEAHSGSYLLTELAGAWRAWLESLRGYPGVLDAPDGEPSPAARPDGDDGGGVGRVTAHDDVNKRKIGPSLDPNGSL